MADIVEATAGDSSFLQFFGAYVCRSVVAPDVSLDQYRAVELALLHEVDLAFFEDRFEGATPAEQRVLEAMARVEGRVPLSRLHVAPPEVSGLNLLVRLVERGLICRATRGAYDFALPLFRDHLQRRAGVTKVTRSVTTGRTGAPGR
jgi:hypothetical protein